MIQANEFRCGNKLLFLGEIVTFKNITEFRDADVFWVKTFERHDEYKSFHFKPIELNEEILLKCGFEKERKPDKCNMYSLNGLRLFMWFDKNHNFDYITANGERVVYESRKRYKFYLIEIGNEIEIKSLHHLQNLYWCLVGSELNVNL